MIDLNDTATLDLITFASVLAKEMFPDLEYARKAIPIET